MADTDKKLSDETPIASFSTSDTIRLMSILLVGGVFQNRAIDVDVIVDFIVAKISNSAPAALDTLKELADALGDDANFAATMTTALAGKQPLDSDLTAIAALATTSYGRALLTLANATALTALFKPAPVSGRYEMAQAGTTGSGTATGSTNMRLQAFELDRAKTINALWAKVAILSASGNFGLAIYAADAATGLPTGAPLASTINMSTGATGNVSQALGAPVTLPPGRYWMAVQCDNATAAFMTRLASDATTMALFGAGALADMAGTAGRIGLAVANTYGTWPTLSSPTLTVYTAASDALIGWVIA